MSVKNNVYKNIKRQTIKARLSILENGVIKLIAVERSYGKSRSYDDALKEVNQWVNDKKLTPAYQAHQKLINKNKTITFTPDHPRCSSNKRHLPFKYFSYYYHEQYDSHNIKVSGVATNKDGVKEPFNFSRSLKKYPVVKAVQLAIKFLKDKNLEYPDSVKEQEIINKLIDLIK